jgi:hypothetical protein
MQDDEVRIKETELMELRRKAAKFGALLAAAKAHLRHLDPGGVQLPDAAEQWLVRRRLTFCAAIAEAEKP